MMSQNHSSKNLIINFLSSFYDRESDSGVAGALVNILVQSGVEVPAFMGEGEEAAAGGGNDEEDEW